MKRVTSMLIALALLAVAGPVLAQGSGSAKAKAKKGFDAAVGKAEQVNSVATLSSLLWSYLANCDEQVSEFDKRQCRVLRDARQEQLETKSFAMAGDDLALTTGEFDTRRRSLPLVVHTCLACAEAVPMFGKSLYVVGAGNRNVVPGDEFVGKRTEVRGPTIQTIAVKLADQAAADKWKADVLPRLRTQFVFRIATPAGGKPSGPAAAAGDTQNEHVWAEGPARGVSLDIVAYRVHDPCTGRVLAARPRATRLPREEAACTGDDLVALQRAREPKKPEVPAGPVIPAQLTPDDIKTSLAPAKAQAQECYATYGVSGEARFRLRIDNEGAITKLDQRGDFTDTPTGICIEKAVRATTFPKSKKLATTVDYPFVLR